MVRVLHRAAPVAGASQLASSATFAWLSLAWLCVKSSAAHGSTPTRELRSSQGCPSEILWDAQRQQQQQVASNFTARKRCTASKP